MFLLAQCRSFESWNFPQDQNLTPKALPEAANFLKMMHLISAKISNIKQVVVKLTPEIPNVTEIFMHYS